MALAVLIRKPCFIEPGEVVLDLESGGGFDCFRESKRYSLPARKTSIIYWRCFDINEVLAVKGFGLTIENKRMK